MIRLDRYLSDLGIATRKEIKKLIKLGLIEVEGYVNVTNDMKIDEKTAKVRYQGQLLNYRSSVFLIMNKPAGVISATHDPFGIEQTVIDILPVEYAACPLFPVGRLDKDTVGLLLLTTDGNYAHKMTSPKKNIFKTYYAIITAPITDGDVQIFEKGMKLDDEQLNPARLFTLDGYTAENGGEGFMRLCRRGSGEKSGFPPEAAEVIVEISEGKYHQVKRMFEAVGKKVLFLKRVKFGDIWLPHDLDEGDVTEYFI